MLFKQISNAYSGHYPYTCDGKFSLKRHSFSPTITGNAIKQWQTFRKRSAMHETGIAREIINIVNETLLNQPSVTVKQIHVIIGEMVAVMPESLDFAYRALTENTPLNNSRLDITIVPVQAQCHNCGKDFSIQEFTFACPFCGKAEIQVTSGNELYIKEIEVY